VLPAHCDEPDERDERGEPPEEDELLDARPDRPPHEDRDLGRVSLDLPERPPDADRAGNRPPLDDKARE
jgi:hypothetical protein